MSKKDYIKWTSNKSKINNEKVRPFFHEREIWFCSLGENIGFEQDGSGENFMRPVLVLRKFNNEVIWALPLTRTEKTGKYYFKISDDNSSVIILTQIRLIDAKRLQYKIGDITEEEFTKIKEALVALLS